MADIEITFNAEGEPHLEGIGFKGKDCDTAMKDFEALFGDEKTRENKPEYNRQGAACSTRQVQAGSGN